MEKNQIKKPKLKPGTKQTEDKILQAPHALVDQFKYLQETIGNQEVRQLMQAGVLSPLKTYEKTIDPKNEKLVKNTSRKKNHENKSIQADRKALAKEINKLLKKKQDELQALIDKNPLSPVYVNVFTELVYAQPPGNKGQEFYHYTRLVDAVFSHKNINKKNPPKKIQRGKSVSVTFSYEYEQVKEPVAARPVRAGEKAKEAGVAPQKTTAAQAKKTGKAAGKGQAKEQIEQLKQTPKNEGAAG